MKLVKKFFDEWFIRFFVCAQILVTHDFENDDENDKVKISLFVSLTQVQIIWTQ